MTYHPLMGISFFFIFLIIAFIIGKTVPISRERKNNVTFLKTKKSMKSDAISPDANWID